METITTSCGDLTVSCQHVSAAATVVTVVGELDVYTCPTLRATLTDVVDRGHVRLVVDLTRCEAIDSTGLGVLVGALKRTRARGGTVVCVTSDPRLMKSFRITGLIRVFAFYDSVARAEEELPRQVAAVGAAPAARPGPAVRPAGGAAAPRHPEVCAGLELSEAAEQEGSSARIALSGCFCQRTAQNLRRRIHDLAGQGRTRLVVGLDGVGHLDGAGLGALVGGLKLLRGEGGTLVLAVTEPRLLKVLRTTGLVKVFEIDATVSEAPRPQARAA